MKKHIATGVAQTHHESRTLPGEGRNFITETAAPGAFAGVVGGTIMALIYMGLAAAFGQGFWALPKMIAGMFWRDLSTLEMPPVAILVGLFIHFSVAIGVGITWSLIFPRTREAHTALIPLALLFTMATYVALNYFFVPFISPPMRRELMHLPWVLGHIAFGFTMAMVVPLRATRWVGRHRAREIPIRA